MFTILKVFMTPSDYIYTMRAISDAWVREQPSKLTQAIDFISVKSLVTGVFVTRRIV